ncbi:hypothetical protein MES5069_680031 [Mesorhizobium escarrei]|uniref:Uncharacterized protein n=1 Tax=Mesorhizobium escarrei TaxID=666018 RepID=A0ABM9EG42_9HYPH|nr:hypothetical protein MES5069_680031 [Mesorhizobium escarrei]
MQVSRSIAIDWSRSGIEEVLS